MKYKEVLNEVHCHYEWIGAALAALGTAASQYQQARARAAQKRQNAMANTPQSGGGASAGQFTPTALSQSAKGSGGDMNNLGIKDLLKPQEEQKFNLGSVGFSDAGQAPAPGSSDKDFHLFTGNELDKEPTYKPPQEQEQKPDNTNAYLSLAQTASQLGQALAQGPPAPPGFMPQPGPMNYQPTALAQLARRRGF